MSIRRGLSDLIQEATLHAESASKYSAAGARLWEDWAPFQRAVLLLQYQLRHGLRLDAAPAVARDARARVEQTQKQFPDLTRSLRRIQHAAEALVRD